MWPLTSTPHEHSKRHTAQKRRRPTTGVVILHFLFPLLPCWCSEFEGRKAADPGFCEDFSYSQHYLLTYSYSCSHSHSCLTPPYVSSPRRTEYYSINGSIEPPLSVRPSNHRILIWHSSCANETETRRLIKGRPSTFCLPTHFHICTASKREVVYSRSW